MTREWISVWRRAFEVATVSATLGVASPSFAQEGVSVDDLPDGHEVILEVSGLRSDGGVLRAGLFDRREVFLTEGEEVATCVASIRHGRAHCELGAVPAGEYAIAFFHDEDEDGRFDRDWIGLPSEGFGFSNDAAPGLGPPSFLSARFSVSTATVHRVHARYGL